MKESGEGKRENKEKRDIVRNGRNGEIIVRDSRKSLHHCFCIKELCLPRVARGAGH